MGLFTFAFLKAMRWMESQHAEAKEKEDDEDYSKMMDQESNQDGNETAAGDNNPFKQ